MHIQLDPTNRNPIYEQITEQVRLRILQKVVVAGDKVPSVREMSSQLMVNPNTVGKAYKELEREGIFVSYRGKGTFISEDVHQLVVDKEVELLKEQVQHLVETAIRAGITQEEMKLWIDVSFDRRRGEQA
ncbi:GntR family transcriptional regulator [Tenuibacillus multivorans]|uniref:GntR family transcriptional regulator n=1 Tax=Tenuibacillus multivorans TaxID=237069 RepID=A0A1H0G538_9BACI|nr:GntR family transcriptional regulator [Tenuibacillus multivorans]GEL78807.1 HTH-type transcriptional repressor YtrA [Tenuibacillus multivorans]SDO02015.1 GntR family transcriptional regulator [Tenuibacillus multivorans]